MHGLRHDLRSVTLAAAVLGVVLARRDAALDVDLPPFLEVLGADLRELAPCDDAMPFGALLARTAAVGEVLGGSNREVGAVVAIVKLATLWPDGR